MAHDWVTAAGAWKAFINEHPELGYRDGKWPFQNFLRLHKKVLVQHDAIRLAKKRFWIAHQSRFIRVAFDCATGAALVASDDGGGAVGLMGTACPRK